MNDSEKTRDYLDRAERYLGQAAAIQAKATRDSVRDRADFRARLNEMMTAFERERAERHKADAEREQRHEREWEKREQEREKLEQKREQERKQEQERLEQEREREWEKREQEREKLEQKREQERKQEQERLEQEREREWEKREQERKREWEKLEREREKLEQKLEQERKQEWEKLERERDQEREQKRQKLEQERKRLEQEREKLEHKRDQKWEKLKELVGGMGETHGRLAEDFFYEALRKNRWIGGMHFGEIRPNVIVDRRGRRAEYDLVMHNGKYVAVVEIKLRLRKTDVEKVHKTLLPNAMRRLPELRGRILVPVVAGMTVDDDAVALAHEYGYVVLSPDGQKVRTDMEYLRYIPCRE